MSRVTSCLVVMLLAVGARAQPPAEPLASVRDADPLDLARAVHQLGDTVVLERIRAGSTATRLAAVRAAPFLEAPELALAPLAELAASRDPTLAPAAMRSVLRIAQALTAAELGAREARAADLAPAREVLASLRDDRAARADLRRAAGAAGHALGALLGD